MPGTGSHTTRVSPEAALTARRFNLPTLAIPLVLVLLAIGGGGVAQTLTSAKSELAAPVGTVIKVISAVAAIALSYYVIYGLSGTKQQAKSLLEKVAPLMPERADMGEAEREEAERKLVIRLETETTYGQGVVAERQAQAGRALNWAAIVSNIVMLGTSIGAKNSLGWLIANTLITNGANLLGFIFFTTLGERNRLLMLQQHTNEIAAKDAIIANFEEEHKAKDAALTLEKRQVESLSAQKAALEAQLEALTAQLRAAGLSPSSSGESHSAARAAEDSAASAAGVGLFRRSSRTAPASAAGAPMVGTAAAAAEGSTAVAHSP